MFLANRILEVANPHSRRRRESISALAQHLFNVQQEFPSHMHRSSPSHYQADAAAAMQDVSSIAQSISHSARFGLDRDVIDAIIRMDRTPTETLHRAFRFARLPHPTTWIEFALDDEDGFKRMGWLLRETGDGDDRTISIQSVLSKRDVADGTPIGGVEPLAYLRRDTIGFVRDIDYATNNISAERMAKEVLMTLLLINSRSRILITDNEPVIDTEFQNRTRRSDPTAPLTLRPITFDLSRIFRTNPGVTEEVARNTRYRTLRDGHFKVRETGVFWWSSHPMRVTEQLHEGQEPNQPEDTPLVINDHRTIRRRPVQHSTPDGVMDFDI
jgi:hypothetical protein